MYFIHEVLITMKKRFTIFSFLVLTLLVISQTLWIQQVAKRDKNRFKEELKASVNDMVKYQITKQTFDLFEINPQNPTLELSYIHPDSIPANAKLFGSVETVEYDKNASLSKFIEAALTEMLFEKGGLNLRSVDTLLHVNFPHMEELSAYSLAIQKQEVTTDSLFFGKNISCPLKDTAKGITIILPLGTSGTYRFVSHFVFEPAPITRRMIALISLSGVAVIAVAIILFMLLFQLQQQMYRMQLHEKRVRGIVHDLKSPLSYIYSMLGLFEMQEKDETKKKQLITGKTRIKQLADHIGRMLSEIKLNEDKRAFLQPEPYDLQQRCTEITDDLKVIYQEKKITVTFTIPADVSILYVDKFYFDCCFRNLLDNAIKYSAKEAVIAITVLKEKKHIRITVRDKGIGIPKREQRSVFAPFYRSNEHSSIKGYGIGLPFVRQIILSHGGSISLDSDVGKGSVFTIRLPHHKPKKNLL